MFFSSFSFLPLNFAARYAETVSVFRGIFTYASDCGSAALSERQEQSHSLDVTLRVTNFPPGAVRRGDEHQADFFAVSH